MSIPMWTEQSADIICKSAEYPIDLKAFVIFYVYILWPDNIRKAIQKQSFHDIKKMPWNLPFTNPMNLQKWFPLSIFPNGPGHDDESMLLSMKLKSCFDSLIFSCFLNINVKLKKSDEDGLGFYSRWHNLKMKNLCDGIKGIFYFLLFQIFYSAIVSS